MDKTHIEPVDTKEKNLTLRFRLFAVAWLLGAITCFSPLVFYRKDIRTVSIAVGVAFLFMAIFTLKQNKISYYLASGVMGIQVAALGISIAMLGNLLMYAPFIWPFAIDALFLLLFVLFSTDSEIKQALNLNPKRLKRKESIKIIITASLGIVFSWLAVWLAGILIEKKLDFVDPRVESIVLNGHNLKNPDSLTSRHFVFDSVPIPKKSLLKIIWQGRHLKDPNRRFSLFVISKDNYIVWLKRGMDTGLLLSAKTMAESCGKVGPCQSMYDWADWIATDRTSFLSRMFRGMSAMFSSNGMIKIKLVKMPDYLGIVEEGTSAKHSIISVDMIGRDYGNIINLQFYSQKHSPEQLWELAKPILIGMKSDIKLGKIKHTLELFEQEKSAAVGKKHINFDRIMKSMDEWNLKGNEEWMEDAQLAFKDGRFEDCKWALVQPILDNYGGGKPYILFGRALMKQGYPDPASFFYRKAEFWMKDNPKLKVLEAEARRELDKQDPTGERFKPDPKLKKLLHEARELLKQNEGKL